MLLVCFSFYMNGQGQTRKLESINVTFQGFDTETFADVSCEDFDSAFKDTKRVKVFHNEHDLSQFKLLASGFKPAKSRSFDVRGNIIYSYNKTTIKYCFDVFGYFYREGKLYYNKKLLIYIADRMYNNHPKYLDTLRNNE